jgi:hypothetical protein
MLHQGIAQSADAWCGRGKAEVTHHQSVSRDGDLQRRRARQPRKKIEGPRRDGRIGNRRTQLIDGRREKCCL